MYRQKAPAKAKIKATATAKATANVDGRWERKGARTAANWN